LHEVIPLSKRYRE